jgi:hypothetical protein
MNYLKPVFSKRIFVLVFFSLISISFIFWSQADHLSNEVTHLRLTAGLPFLNLIENKVNITYFKDTIDIYYYKNNVLYFLPYIEQNQMGDSILIEERKYSCFLFDKDSCSGYFFGSLEGTFKAKKLSVDSVLTKRGHYGMDFYLDDKCTYIEKVVESDGIVMEKYYNKDNILNLFYHDSIYVYFDKRLNNIGLSISKSIDKIKNQKLCKVRLIFNEKFSEKHHVMLPKREMYFEIKKIENNNPAETINFIEKLNKAIGAQYSRR